MEKRRGKELGEPKETATSPQGKPYDGLPGKRSLGDTVWCDSILSTNPSSKKSGGF